MISADQRSMLKVLQSLKFFSHAHVRKKLAEVDGVVRRIDRSRSGTRPLSNGELVISYLDGPAKSGAEFARFYAEESGMRPVDVLERGRLRKYIEETEHLRAIVLVDDFVGTGSSAVAGLQLLHDDIADLVRARDLKIVFACVVGFAEGWTSVCRFARELKLGVETFCCEVLDDGHRVFGEGSAVFHDNDERERAKALASRLGALSERHAPLGYGGLRLAVIFERGCPNNTLPILWGESTKPPWRPLFPRH